MKKFWFGFFGFLSFFVICTNYKPEKSLSGAPPFGLEENQIPNDLNPYSLFVNWERPKIKAKVGIQIGHWKNSEVPKELENLKGNTGATGRNISEVEVNYKIAKILAEILQNEGVVVDIIPSTVTPNYWADVFIAIHADGSTDSKKSGYKFAGPWRDFTGKSDKLVSFLEESYEEKTNLEKDNNITKNMKGYYAFNWWKYEHSIHPMTTAVIAETGFLTNRFDQKLLIDNSKLSAEALAEGLIKYLKSEKLI